MSALMRHAHRWPPDAVIISSISGTSGMSRSAICFFIILVVRAVTPGRPAMPCGMEKPNCPGMCIAVLPM